MLVIFYSTIRRCPCGIK